MFTKEVIYRNKVLPRRFYGLFLPFLQTFLHRLPIVVSEHKLHLSAKKYVSLCCLFIDKIIIGQVDH